MRKFILSITCLFLVIVLAACNNYEERATKLSTVTVNHKKVQVPTSFIEPLQNKTKSKMIVIQTKYGKIYYPKRWQHQLKIEQEMNDHLLKVYFYGVFSDQKILLFQLTIGDIMGDYIGKITDLNGKSHRVFVDMKSAAQFANLTDQDKEQVFAMQDAINELLEHLSN